MAFRVTPRTTAPRRAGLHQIVPARDPARRVPRASGTWRAVDPWRLRARLAGLVRHAEMPGVVPPVVEAHVQRHVKRAARRARAEIYSTGVLGPPAFAVAVACAGHGLVHVGLALSGVLVALPGLCGHGFWRARRLEDRARLPWGRILRRSYPVPTPALPAALCSDPVLRQSLGLEAYLARRLRGNAHAEIFWCLQESFEGCVASLVHSAAALVAATGADHTEASRPKGAPRRACGVDGPACETGPAAHGHGS